MVHLFVSIVLKVTEEESRLRVFSLPTSLRGRLPIQIYRRRTIGAENDVTGVLHLLNGGLSAEMRIWRFLGRWCARRVTARCSDVSVSSASL